MNAALAGVRLTRYAPCVTLKNRTCSFDTHFDLARRAIVLTVYLNRGQAARPCCDAEIAGAVFSEWGRMTPKPFGATLHILIPTLGRLESSMSARCRLLLAVSLLGLTGAALAQDLPANMPKRKPGLWEMQSAGMGGQSQTMKLCLDADTDKAMYKMGTQMSGHMCSKFNIGVQGSTVVSDAECKLDMPSGAVTMTSHSETTFSGDTSYSTKGTMKYQPAVMGRSEMAMTSSGRWLGECPAGQKPGDMVMPNGQTMNLKDLPQH